MKISLTGTMLLGLAFGGVALAEITPVLNPSFETPGPDINIDCHTILGACAYSDDGNIPSWSTSSATDVGQIFKIQDFPASGGNPAPPDGSSYIAWSRSPSIFQDVGTVVSGETYTLSVDVLHRIDANFDGSIEFLLGSGGLSGAIVGSVSGSDLGAGTWTTLTDVFTPSGAENGEILTIVLNSSGEQGDYDNVRLSGSDIAGTPEPGTLALFGTALAGFGLLRRKRNV